MAHIYVFSPSSAVRERAAFRLGLKRLREMGHEVDIDQAALDTHMRFAGDDDVRLAAIHRAAASGADVALITRGGYGLSRILGSIRWKALEKAVGQGTRFVGMSDFTALQNGLLARTGAVTWAGPSLCADFGAPDGVDDITLACFDDLASGQGEGTGWRLPAGDARLYAGRRIAGEPVLWGGNLAVLCSLIGTPWMPALSGILFLEDVSEHPYRVERMLLQLLHAGILGRQKAVILGQFSNYRLAPHDKGYRLSTVVNYLRGIIKAPVLTGLPHGHVQTKVCLPVGQPVKVLIEGGDAMVLWAHPHPA